MEAAVKERGGRGPVDEAAERRRREKKRIQNRNSQKLSREKQASYTRALEHIVNSIDKWDPESSESPMVKTMMQLRDENSQLRGLVLRMRKRFLSLSTMAATDADDCKLDFISSAEASNNASSNEGNSLIPASHAPTEQPASAFLEGENSSSCYLPAKDMSTFTFNPLSIIQDNLTADSLLSLSAAKQTLPQLTFSNLNTGGRSSFSASAIVDGAQRLLRTESSVKRVITEMEAEGKLNKERFQQVLGPAIRLMMKNSPLEGFIDATGTPYYLEKIIRWRISPTFENREDIPHPFTPTVLQQHFSHRHPFIDFIPWGEFRDQVLLYMGEIDMAQLLEDLIHHYVQNVPQLNAALPLLDTYHELHRLCTSDQQKTEVFPDNCEESQSSIFFSVTSMVRKYGLAEYGERKLNPAFSKKYPFFDIAKIVTKLPVLPYQVAIVNGNS